MGAMSRFLPQAASCKRLAAHVLPFAFNKIFHADIGRLLVAVSRIV